MAISEQPRRSGTAVEISDSDNDSDEEVLPFSLEDSFYEHLGTSDGGIYVYRDITPDTAERFFEKRDARRQKLRLHYHPWEQTLMVTVPSKPLEIGQSVLHSLILQQLPSLAGAGVDGWAPCGSATFGEMFATTGKGEGDDSGLPASDRNRDWPTLVVEAAWSQSTADVRQKMRWWFMASNHGVKTVLVVILGREGQCLTIEKYTEGRETDDNAPDAAPVLQQTITMTLRRQDTRNRLPVPGGDAVYTRPEAEDEEAQELPAFSAPRPATRAAASQRPLSTQESADCAGGPLRLEFASLFLREPVEELGEHDVVVPTQDLASMAGLVFGVSRYPRGEADAGGRRGLDAVRGAAPVRDPRWMQPIRPLAVLSENTQRAYDSYFGEGAYARLLGGR